MLLIAGREVIDLRTKLLRGFADPSRLLILEVFRVGPLTVSGIAEATGLSQSDVSAHVACLRDCGLVIEEPQGCSAHYRLSDRRVGQFLRLIDELLVDAAKGVSECARYNFSQESTHG